MMLTAAASSSATSESRKRCFSDKNYSEDAQDVKDDHSSNRFRGKRDDAWVSSRSESFERLLECSSSSKSHLDNVKKRPPPGNIQAKSSTLWQKVLPCIVMPPPPALLVNPDNSKSFPSRIDILTKKSCLSQKYPPVSSALSPFPAAQEPACPADTGNWTPSQHRDFGKAIFNIGLEKCSPAQLRREMIQQPPQLNGERVKSRLQKFRQYFDKERHKFMEDYDQGMVEQKEQIQAGDNAEASPLGVPVYGGQAAAMVSNKVLLEEARGELGDNDGRELQGSTNAESMKPQASNRRDEFTEVLRLTGRERETSLGMALENIQAKMQTLAKHLVTERRTSQANAGYNYDHWNAFVTELEDFVDPADLAIIFHAQHTRFFHLGEGLELTSHTESANQEAIHLLIAVLQMPNLSSSIHHRQVLSDFWNLRHVRIGTLEQTRESRRPPN